MIFNVLRISRQLKSIKGQRSTRLHRYLSVLKSAVLSNRRLMEQLDIAERTAKESESLSQSDSASRLENPTTEHDLGNLFEKQAKAAITPCEAVLVLAAPEMLDRGV